MGRKAVKKVSILRFLQVEFNYSSFAARAVLGRGHVSIDGRVLAADEVWHEKEALTGKMIAVGQRQTRMFGSRRESDPQLTLPVRR